jgi:tetratricopeptide (TPR) repeat protein
MKRILLVVGAIVLVAAVSALVWLNPNEVEFRPTHVHSFRSTLGLLVVFAFFAGLLVAVLGGVLRNAGSVVGNWGARRSARRATQAGAMHQAGEQLGWGGEVERSRALLRKAWRRHPGNGAAALALASSYMDTGEYVAAQEVLAAAVAEHANDPDLRYALGEALRRRGEGGEAIRMLETVRVQHPHAPRVLISLRELYRESGRWQEAADVQAAYVQTLPAEARVGEQDRLARFRYQAALALHDPAARLAALDELVRSDRAFVPAIVSLGDALAGAGRADEAQKLWERAFKNQPRLVFIERMLALDAGPRSRAVTLLGKYRDQLDLDSVRLLSARLALAAGDVDRADAELDAIERQDTPTVQRARAEILHRRGRHAEAWEALRRAADCLGALATDHRCAICGRLSEAWAGYCEGCERWDTYRSGTELSGAPESGRR